MVALKIRKIGNSLGIILPKEIISRLNVQEDGNLYLTETDDGDYRLGTYDAEFEKKITTADDIIKRYSNTLRVLSK